MWIVQITNDKTDDGGGDNDNGGGDGDDNNGDDDDNDDDIMFRKNMPELHQSENIKRVFQEFPIVAYQRGRNLGDTLVHGKTNRVMRDLAVFVEKCQKKCVVCEMLKRDSNGAMSLGKGLIQGKNAECGIWDKLFEM
ncbi:hypothetical protein ACF0H5_018421 [Mactra antiquata]